MKLTYHELIRIICALIFIVIFTIGVIYLHKTRKNNGIGQVVFVDRFSIEHFMGLISLVIYFVGVIVFCIAANASSIAGYIIISTIWFLLMIPSDRIVISEKGIGGKDFLGNINKFIEWGNPKEFKWTNSSTIKISWKDEKNHKLSMVSMVSKKNKNQIISLIKQYDSNYCE